VLRCWDAEHYLRIAREGYSTDAEARPLIVFFPVYPLLIAALAPILGHMKAAFAVTTAASIAGHTLLFHYLRLIGLDARRVTRVMTLVFVSPIAIYFSAIYTEALYFLVTVSFLILLRREQYFLAAACGFVAALTRSMGVLFVIPYLFAVWGSGPRTVVLRRSAYAALIGFGTAVYLAINTWVQGDPLAFSAHQSSNWYKSSVNPIKMYRKSLLDLFSGHWGLGPGYELIYLDRIATLLFPGLCLAYAWSVYGPRFGGDPSKKEAAGMPPGFFLWAVAQWLIVCSQSFWVSNLRYLSLVLPAYLMLERVFSRRFTFAVYALISAAIAVWAVRQYVRLSWVF
jgi:hypothetical protein